MQVLEIEFGDIVDLIRFNINVKQERVGLISYKRNGLFYVGFYYPSFLKKIFLSFLYTTLKTPPPPVYLYNSEPINNEYLVEEPVSTHMMIKIPVAYIDQIPHASVDPEKIKGNWRYIKVRDLKSLLFIALSAYYESSDLPYIWYDLEKKAYILGVHSTGDSESINLYFYLEKEYMGPYLSLSSDLKNIGVEKSIRDVSKSYFLIVKVKKLSYLHLKRK